MKQERAQFESFASAFWADVDSESVQPVESYIKSFPGCSAGVIREFYSWNTGSEPTNEEGSTGPEHSATSMSMAGSTIAQYELIKELGHGGQGYVFLARDQVNDREVALKVMNNHHALDPKSRLRFVREAEAAGKLEHPGLCAVYEFGEYEGMPFLAMEFVRGMPLSERIAEAAHADEGAHNLSFVDFDTAVETAGNDVTTWEAGEEKSSGQVSSYAEIMSVVRLIEQVAMALDAAHNQSLIHRDIKPANIMIRDNGQPVVLDFGLARDDDSAQATLTQTGDLMGTPAYMSPEQITRSSIKVDKRSDVYSLGVTLFECLTLRRPFVAPTIEKLYQAIMFDDVPDLQDINPSIPDDLCTIVEMALEKSPARRYQSAREFAEDLNRVRMRLPTFAQPIGVDERIRRWMRRNPIVALATILSFIALTAIAVVFYVKGEEANDERLKADAARQRAVKESEEKTRALAAEKKQRQEKENALSEKSEALIRIRRLADARRLKQATLRAEKIWPSRARNAEKLRQWLSDYKALSQSLPGHKADVESLRKSALPYTEEQRALDHADTFAEIAELEAQVAKARSDPNAKTNPAVKKEIDQFVRVMGQRIAAFKEITAKRVTWDFAGDDVKLWRHGVLTDLVENLEGFCDPETGTYALVQKRLEIAESIEKKTIDEHLDAWNETIEDVADSPQYRGFKMEPQVGFIPLGEDPDSGLAEFLHYETHRGAIPERNEHGKIPLSAETGLIFVLIPPGRCLVGAQKDDPAKPNFDPSFRSDEGIVDFSCSKPFLLSKYELTQAQWQRCHMPGDLPCSYKAGWKFPGVKIGVGWLNPLEGASWQVVHTAGRRLGLRLPTSGEWEYAARAGSTSVWVGDNNDIKALSAWGNLAGSESRGLLPVSVPSLRDDFVVHAPVGRFKANKFGLYDILGNVHEWTSTKLGPILAVYRGGSFNNEPILGRLAMRGSGPRKQGRSDVGLRPAASLTD